MKYLLFYEMAAGAEDKIQANFPSHRARLQEYHEQGTLLMVGPYGSPPVGALGIFTSREAAESFVAGDPFIHCGAVSKHTVYEWAEALAP